MENIYNFPVMRYFFPGVYWNVLIKNDNFIQFIWLCDQYLACSVRQSWGCTLMLWSSMSFLKILFIYTTSIRLDFTDLSQSTRQIEKIKFAAIPIILLSSFSQR